MKSGGGGSFRPAALGSLGQLARVVQPESGIQGDKECGFRDWLQQSSAVSHGISFKMVPEIPRQKSSGRRFCTRNCCYSRCSCPGSASQLTLSCRTQNCPGTAREWPFHQVLTCSEGELLAWGTSSHVSLQKVLPVSRGCLLCKIQVWVVLSVVSRDHSCARSCGAGSRQPPLRRAHACPETRGEVGTWCSTTGGEKTEPWGQMARRVPMSAVHSHKPETD